MQNHVNLVKYVKLCNMHFCICVMFIRNQYVSNQIFNMQFLRIVQVQKA